MKFFSLFTGIGGLDYGLMKIADCVGISDIKESSVEIYKKNYGDVKNFGDLTEMNFNDVPDFDLLVGGFPCQTFSLAGLRRGFEDKKGKMIFYIHELLKVKQPRYFVLENVKGIMSHNKGRTIKDVVKLLNDAGYYVRVVLLNALNYGSAQNRERIIFLGCKDDFERKVPEIKDRTKLFRDFRDQEGPFKYPNKTTNFILKMNQKKMFNFELIGGYDRVGTLTTQEGCGEKLVYEMKADDFRILTPLECERLQGFPDGWTEGISKNNRYFALGNAVSCNVSEYLFLDYLDGLWWDVEALRNGR